MAADESGLKITGAMRTIGFVATGLTFLLVLYNGVPFVTKGDLQAAFALRDQRIMDHIQHDEIVQKGLVEDIADIRERKKKLEDIVEEMRLNQVRVLQVLQLDQRGKR